MADGTRKPIEAIRPGEHVIATNPETGETAARPVSALITGDGTKELVNVTVDTDGAQGDDTGAVVATDGHPFWNAEQKRWLTAEELTPGQNLYAADGRAVAITAVQHYEERRTVHNLSIDGIHTYYVHVQGMGSWADVLVHNIGPGSCVPSTATRGEPRLVDGNSKEGWAHINKRHIPGAAPPEKQGSKFAPGTTRAQIERAAHEILRYGTRQSHPSQTYQVFEHRMTINGKRTNYRLVIDTSRNNVIISLFPIGGK